MKKYQVYLAMRRSPVLLELAPIELIVHAKNKRAAYLVARWNHGIGVMCAVINVNDPNDSLCGVEPK